MTSLILLVLMAKIYYIGYLKPIHSDLGRYMLKMVKSSLQGEKLFRGTLEIFLKADIPSRLQRWHQALGGNKKIQISMHARGRKIKAAISTRVRNLMSLLLSNFKNIKGRVKQKRLSVK